MDLTLIDGIKAALFDLDGVVLDTEPQYSRFWEEQFARHFDGHAELSDAIKGQTLTQVFDRYFSDDKRHLRPIILASLEQFEQSMYFPYISGFQPFLSLLRSRGVKTAVVTSSNRQKMANVYRCLPDFQSQFDAILTSEDFAYSKPAPDCYLTAARRLDVAIDDCLVFEDSFNGLHSAQAAGMRAIGLATTNPAQAIAPLCHAVISNYL